MADVSTVLAMENFSAAGDADVVTMENFWAKLEAGGRI
jgi:hypothetical protein